MTMALPSQVILTPESRTIRKIWERCVITETGCFRWTGGRSKGGGKKRQPHPGYGSVWVEEAKTTRRVHVVIGEAFHGPLPDDDYEWGHACGDSLCCNPRDVVPQTKEENRRERIERHRRIKEGGV